MKKAIILSAAALIVTGLGLIALLVSKKDAVKAETVIVRDNDLYLVNKDLSEKRLTTDQNVVWLFDRKNGIVLYGQRWGDVVAESEGVSEMRLHSVSEAGAGDKIITEALVTDAFFDQSGKRVYYVTKEADCYVANADGSDSRRIAEKVLRPNLSPDGQKLVYQKLNGDWQPGQYYDQAQGLAVTDLAMGEERLITNRWEDFNPIWTPDGSRILFFSINAEGLTSHYVVRPDGTELRQLTNMGQKLVTDQTVPVPSEKPVWSRDGRFLVYESDRQIWLNEFSADYSSLVVSRPLGYGRQPVWRSDGQSITMLASESGNAKDSLIILDLSGKIINPK